MPKENSFQDIAKKAMTNKDIANTPSSASSAATTTSTPSPTATSAPASTSSAATAVGVSILDYARTFTQTFAQSPLNEVDILIFSQLMYQKMPQCVPRFSDTLARQETFSSRFTRIMQHRSTRNPLAHPIKSAQQVLFPQLESVSLRTVSAALPHADFSFEQGFAGVAGVNETEELLRTLAANPRFADVSIGAYVDVFDTNQETQFAAAAFVLPSSAASPIDTLRANASQSATSASHLAINAPQSVTNVHKRHTREDQSPVSSVQTGKPQIIIVFRGTDSSFVGWKEDFNMSFQYPVPAQRQAAQYVNRLGHLYKNYSLLTAGHSKGGNLAVYAALHADGDIQQRIQRVFSLDGPGFPQEVIASPSYAAIAHKITKIVPETSIVGMIFDTPEQCKVVKSSESGIMQHLAFSWQIDAQSIVESQFLANAANTTNATNTRTTTNTSFAPKISNPVHTTNSTRTTAAASSSNNASTANARGRNQPHFIVLPQVDSTSQFFSASLRQWLEQLPNSKREQVIDSMFSVLQASGVQSFMQLPSKLNRAIPHMLEAWHELSKEDRAHIIETFTLFAQTAWQQRNILQGSAQPNIAKTQPNNIDPRQQQDSRR